MLLHRSRGRLATARDAAGKPTPRGTYRPRLEPLDDRLTPSSWFVNTFADETAPGGTLSLREAIDLSNHTPGANSITLQAGTYNLTRGNALSINTNSLTIVGQGAGLTTVNALGLSSVFFIKTPGLTVKFVNLTITGGLTTGAGGGVYMADPGTLVFSGANVSGNVAGELGGGIFQEGGNFIFSNSTLSNNVALGNGGGYLNYGAAGTGPANMLINGSNVLDNSSGGSGGGISVLATDGGLTVTNSTITSNSASGNGGGIYTKAPTFTVTGSDISNNLAGGDGGGIDHDYTSPIPHILTQSITSSHVNGNTAGFGGGIRLAPGDSLKLDSSTVNGNGAGTDGGGIDGAGSGVTLTSASQVNKNHAGDPVLVLGFGGGIYDASVTVQGGSQVNGNVSAGPGGGIYSNGRDVVVAGSQVLYNVALSDGGGIFAGAGSLPVSCTVSIRQGSQVSGNTAAGKGGGIWMMGGNLNIGNSTVGNNASVNSGGGVYLGAGGANTIVVLGSTFSGNRAGWFGGALYLATGGPADTNPIWAPNGSILASSTISNNSAQLGGGGITFAGAGLALIDDTIASNSTRGGGGGLYVYNASGTVNVGNSIIALNVSTSGNLANGYDVYDTFKRAADLGGNLIGINTGSAFVPGTPNRTASYVGTSGSPLDPKLRPLAFNGGSTQTRALLPGSLALQHGLAALNVSYGLSTDQRGKPRSPSKPDIGAFDPPPARRASPLRPARVVDLLCVDDPLWTWLAG
jgi:hypothetical protein